MSGDIDAMAASLRGLALGDGFGGRWFWQGPNRAAQMIEDRRTPSEQPFYYSDDTALALCVVRMLSTGRRIVQSHLAALFGATYLADPHRQYGYGMSVLLPKLYEYPEGFAEAAGALFDGMGSLGNGSAMRVAPLGAYFHADLERVAEQAALSAAVTHTHPEAVDGAVAVALAAALSAAGRGRGPESPEHFLRRVATLVPEGVIRSGVEAAAALDPATPAWKAADVLGNGQHIRCSDTVPFALWTAAVHQDDYEAAMWATAAGLGDVDTTCAITGGIVAARTGIDAAPRVWLELREPLPDWAEQLAADPGTTPEAPPGTASEAGPETPPGTARGTR
jgi:ADP-ribosylglycohydrolase